MSGERDLGCLLATLKPVMEEGTYVFATVPAVLPDLTPRMVFREAEGITLILRREEAEAHGIAHEFPSRMITLDVHSSLEAVGFIARIATALAERGMGVNPVAGFYHDHLFVPEGLEEEALAVLAELVKSNAP